MQGSLKPTPTPTLLDDNGEEANGEAGEKAAGAVAVKEARDVARGSTASFEPQHLAGPHSSSEPIKPGVLLDWIDNAVENEASCTELPLAIILMLSFAVMALYHMNMELIYGVEEAIEFAIVENANFGPGHQGFEDVNNIADLWSWIRLGYIPLMIQTEWAYSELLGDAEESNASTSDYVPVASRHYPNMVPIRGDYLFHNRIVGGVRFRQEVMDVSFDYCHFPDEVPEELAFGWYKKACKKPSRDFMTHPEYAHAEGLVGPASAPGGGYKGDRETWLLLTTFDLDNRAAMLVDMEDGCQDLETKGRTRCLCDWCAAQEPPQPWVDERTSRVELNMVIFNPEHGVFILVGVNFFFNTGGRIYKLIHIQSSWMSPLHWHRGIMYIGPMLCADMVWFILTFYMLVNELIEIKGVIGRKGVKGLYTEYFGFWNAVDWISITTAFQILGQFSFWNTACQGTSASFKAVMETTMDPQALDELTSTPEGRQQWVSQLADFHSTVETMVAQEKMVRFSLFYYPVIVMLRLFKSFAAQPKLAVVTMTLFEAGSDMGHFFIVFISVFIAFTVSGVILFGQDLEGFATVDRAIHTCFRAMMGDFDWNDMETVGRSAAMLWFWLFLLVVNVIVLNIVLAILMDSYAGVKGRIDAGAISVPDQVGEMYHDWSERRHGRMVSLRTIRTVVAKQAKATPNMEFTPEFLVSILPEMPLDQATNVLKKAQEAHDANDEKQEEEDNNIQTSDSFFAVGGGGWDRSLSAEADDGPPPQMLGGRVRRMGKNMTDIQDVVKGLGAAQQQLRDQLNEQKDLTKELRQLMKDLRDQRAARGG